MFDNIVKIFKFARKSQNMTQAELAEKLHISDKAWSKIETGANQLEFQYIKPACDALNLPYLEILQEICPVLPDRQSVLQEHQDGRVVSIRYSPEEDGLFGASKQAAEDAFESYVEPQFYFYPLDVEFVKSRGGQWYDVMVTNSEYALMQVLADYIGVAVDDSEFGLWFLELVHWSCVNGLKERNVLKC